MRYGFNGKENDKNFGTAGLTQDYGFRLYNPAIAKFLSVDPLFKSYAELTPYQFASNSPVFAIDLDGLEGVGGFDMSNKQLRTVVGTVNKARIDGSSKLFKQGSSSPHYYVFGLGSQVSAGGYFNAETTFILVVAGKEPGLYAVPSKGKGITASVSADTYLFMGVGYFQNLDKSKAAVFQGSAVSASVGVGLKIVAGGNISYTKEVGVNELRTNPIELLEPDNILTTTHKITFSAGMGVDLPIVLSGALGISEAELPVELMSFIKENLPKPTFTPATAEEMKKMQDDAKQIKPDATNRVRGEEKPSRVSLPAKKYPQ